MKEAVASNWSLGKGGVKCCTTSSCHVHPVEEMPVICVCPLLLVRLLPVYLLGDLFSRKPQTGFWQRGVVRVNHGLLMMYCLMYRVCSEHVSYKVRRKA